MFSIALGFALLSVTSVNAQDRPGGLFGISTSDEPSRGGLMSPGTKIDYSFTVNTQDFGQDVPLGSGIAVLLGLGLGYATLKRKEDKQ